MDPLGNLLGVPVRHASKVPLLQLVAQLAEVGLRHVAANVLDLPVDVRGGVRHHLLEPLESTRDLRAVLTLKPLDGTLGVASEVLCLLGVGARRDDDPGGSVRNILVQAGSPNSMRVLHVREPCSSRLGERAVQIVALPQANTGSEVLGVVITQRVHVQADLLGPPKDIVEPRLEMIEDWLELLGDWQDSLLVAELVQLSLQLVSEPLVEATLHQATLNAERLHLPSGVCRLGRVRDLFCDVLAKLCAASATTTADHLLQGTNWGGVANDCAQRVEHVIDSVVVEDRLGLTAERVSDSNGAADWHVEDVVRQRLAFIGRNEIVHHVGGFFGVPLNQLPQRDASSGCPAAFAERRLDSLAAGNLTNLVRNASLLRELAAGRDALRQPRRRVQKHVSSKAGSVLKELARPRAEHASRLVLLGDAVLGQQVTTAGAVRV